MCRTSLFNVKVIVYPLVVDNFFLTDASGNQSAFYTLIEAVRADLQRGDTMDTEDEASENNSLNVVNHCRS